VLDCDDIGVEVAESLHDGEIVTLRVDLHDSDAAWDVAALSQ
jgi:hypothetical protein